MLERLAYKFKDIKRNIMDNNYSMITRYLVKYENYKGIAMLILTSTNQNRAFNNFSYEVNEKTKGKIALELLSNSKKIKSKEFKIDLLKYAPPIYAKKFGVINKNSQEKDIIEFYSNDIKGASSFIATYKKANKLSKNQTGNILLKIIKQTKSSTQEINDELGNLNINLWTTSLLRYCIDNKLITDPGWSYDTGAVLGLGINYIIKNYEMFAGNLNVVFTSNKAERFLLAMLDIIKSKNLKELRENPINSIVRYLINNFNEILDITPSLLDTFRDHKPFRDMIRQSELYPALLERATPEDIKFLKSEKGIGNTFKNIKGSLSRTTVKNAKKYLNLNLNPERVFSIGEQYLRMASSVK